MSENLSALSGRKGLNDNLFEHLVDVAKTDGCPTDEQLKDLAYDYLMGNAVTYGTASFYDFLNESHKGVKIHICSGSACLVAATQKKVRSRLLEHFEEKEIGEMCCLGRCHENSAFNYNGFNYSGSAIDTLDKVLSDETQTPDNYSVNSRPGKTILTGEPMTIGEFKIAFKKLIEAGPERSLDQLKRSNIRGRGGAGFPLGMKMESCKNTKSDQKFIVCNADEGDPGAYSDRYLLEKQPLRILFGMLTAGFIVGADKGVVYIRAEYPESVVALKQAVQLLNENRLQGDSIAGSKFNFSFKIIEGAGAYICGEETALLSSLEGQRPEVRIRPPYPAQVGLFNKPTVVNNVETLAAIPWILAHGGEKYASFGTKESSGTKLVCLDSYFQHPGIYEVEMGTSFHEVIYQLGGGFKEGVKAIHVGGPLGGIVPVSKIDNLTLDFESFSKEGFLLGHAGIVSIPDKFPMIDYLEHLFEFTADESCGKCFPCSIGSVRGKEMLEDARLGKRMIDRQLMDDLLETMEIGSLCALGGGLPLGIKNALHYFKDELSQYFDSTKLA